MELPGGLWDGARRQRSFAFRPITGEVELAVLEQAASPAPLPCRVTAVLAAALAHVGGEAAHPGRVHSLAVGDRQFLVRHLAGVLGCDVLWLIGACEGCGARFDVPVRQSELPVKEAGAAFPHPVVTTSWGRCRLRMVTGADQEAIAHIADDRVAARTLARRCVLEPEPPEGEIAPGDAAGIEQALEDAAPEVATLAATSCPDCGRAGTTYIDPYACLSSGADALWDEIHELATAYHWAERDILALPRARRRIYLRRIAAARGTSYADA